MVLGVQSRNLPGQVAEHVREWDYIQYPLDHPRKLLISSHLRLLTLGSLSFLHSILFKKLLAEQVLVSGDAIFIADPIPCLSSVTSKYLVNLWAVVQPTCLVFHFFIYRLGCR